MFRKSLTFITAIAVTLLLASCGSDKENDVEAGIAEVCESVFAEGKADSAANLLIINDGTASAAKGPFPEELAADISSVSEQGGSLTIISVDGEGALSEIAAKDIALSTSGPRDRPSVAKLAEVMPTCIETLLSTLASPTAPGTDLHQSFALASELITPETVVWLLSDFIPTAGQISLKADDLSSDPQMIGTLFAKNVPLDFLGVPLKVDGIGNTHENLLTAHREWLKNFSVSLCEGWKFSGCENIDSSPIKALMDDDGKPEDFLPDFPTLEMHQINHGCALDFPAAIIFAGDSAQLREDASHVFAPAISMLQDNPNSTAIITGHAASSPDHTQSELEDLSKRRAAAVGGLFEQNSIAESRVSLRGVGDSEPKAEDLDADGMQIESIAAGERRVDIVIEGVICE